MRHFLLSCNPLTEGHWENVHDGRFQTGSIGRRSWDHSSCHRASLCAYTEKRIPKVRKMISLVHPRRHPIEVPGRGARELKIKRVSYWLSGSLSSSLSTSFQVFSAHSALIFLGVCPDRLYLLAPFSPICTCVSQDAIPGAGFLPANLQRADIGPAEARKKQSHDP